MTFPSRSLQRNIFRPETEEFVAASKQAGKALTKYVSNNALVGDPRDDAVDYIRTREFKPTTMLALRQLVSEIGDETVLYKDLARVPNDKIRNFRNDMYMITEALRLIQGPAPDTEVWPAKVRCRRFSYADELQEARRQRYQVHPHVGQGSSCHRAWAGHHGGLEAHRHHGG